MNHYAYASGVKLATQTFGLKQSSDPDDEDRTGRNVAMLGAGALPFASTIGTQPVRHLTGGETIEQWTNVPGALRRGDVLVTSDPKYRGMTALIGLVSGTPEGTHVAVVVDDHGNVVESHPIYGIKKRHVSDATAADERIHVLRPNHMTEKQIHEHTNRLTALADKADQVEAATIKHLSSTHSPEEAKRLARIARKSFYSKPQGSAAGIHELFMPKFVTARAQRGEQKAMHAAVEALDPEQTGKTFAEYFRTKYPATPSGITGLFKRVKNRLYGYGDFDPEMQKLLPDCTAGNCSTLPAMAMPEGVVINNTKLPTEILPVDYARSDKYDAVARYNPEPKLRPYEKVLKRAPTLTRLGAGAALAGTVYTGSRLYDSMKNETSDK